MATLTAQQALLAHSWPQGESVRVRMGLHTGEPTVSSTGYVGMDVHRAARIAASGHGGTGRPVPAHCMTWCPGRPARRSEPAGSGLPPPERPAAARAALSAPPRRSAGAVPTPQVARLPPQQPASSAHDLHRPGAGDGRRRGAADNHRLLTLTGSGGAGQDPPGAPGRRRPAGRFAGRRVAGRAGAAGRPGAGAADGRLGRWASSEEPGRPLPPPSPTTCESQELLLLLDNCEHLLAACAQLADALLRACPDLHILATSRERWASAGETVWRVPSLSLPDPQGLPRRERIASPA